MKENELLILTWKNISVWTKKRKKFGERKRLLTNVSGIAKSGALTAILSPSGGGKTTLLATLSKRFKGDVAGEILVNGCELSEKKMSFVSGYVCQKALTYEDLTVYEHLIFMARLKMDKNSTLECRHRNILKVTNSLLLDNKLDVTICSLSGGQKKRLTLAVQLLTEPKILFCDEPTTGLDSYSAKQVVKLLRALADEGKMVLCSIHQPASGIFELFDDVTLLTSNGKLGFYGPISLIDSYLARLGAPCPENFSLCEFIVCQVTIQQRSDDNLENDGEAKVQRIVNAFSQSKLFESLISEIQNERHNNLALHSNIKNWERESVSFRTEFGWLLWRIIQLNKHSFKTIFIRFFTNAILFVVISLFYTNAPKENQTGIRNTMGFLYVFTQQISYTSFFFVLHEIPKDIPVFTLEAADRLYSPLSFYLTKAIFLSASLGIQSIVYTLLSFSINGLHETFFSLIMITAFSVILTCCSGANGVLLSTAFRGIETSSLFSVPLEFINRLFCGMQIKLSSLPWFLAILKYVSFQYYSFEALNILHWINFHHLGCDQISGVPCLQTGDDVLSSVGFNRDDIMLDFIGLVTFTFFWHFLAFIFLIRELKTFAAY